MNPEEKQQIENYISGRMEVETDGPDIIIKVRPLEGDPPPTGEYVPDRSIRIKFSDEQRRYLAKIGRHKGPFFTALGRGLWRGVKVAGNVGLLFAVGAGGALVKGVTNPLGLVGAGVTAAAVGIGPVMAAEKVLKAAPGKNRHGLSAVLVLLGKLFIEVYHLLKSRKEK